MTDKAEAEKELQRAILIVAVVMIIALLVGVSLFINGAFNLDPLNAPEAPTLQSATVGDRNVTLTWKAPEYDGGRAISSYSVYFGTAPPLSLYQEYSTPTFVANVSGLAPGMAYSFAVCATNSAGISAQSNILNVTACTAPGAPTLISVEPWNGSIILTWRAPMDNGSSNIAGYRISIDDTLGTVLYDDIQKSSFQELVYYIETLSPAPPYAIKVAAMNQAGVGAYSNNITITP